MASRALPWMLHEMSAAGSLEKIKSAWIPCRELTGTTEDARQ